MTPIDENGQVFPDLKNHTGKLGHLVSLYTQSICDDFLNCHWDTVFSNCNVFLTDSLQATNIVGY